MNNPYLVLRKRAQKTQIAIIDIDGLEKILFEGGRWDAKRSLPKFQAEIGLKAFCEKKGKNKTLVELPAP